MLSVTRLIMKRIMQNFGIRLFNYALSSCSCRLEKKVCRIGSPIWTHIVLPTNPCIRFSSLTSFRTPCKNTTSNFKQLQDYLMTQFVVSRMWYPFDNTTSNLKQLQDYFMKQFVVFWEDLDYYYLWRVCIVMYTKQYTGGRWGIDAYCWTF